MPVELHERLSEFSYGYGVTREVEWVAATAGAIGDAVLAKFATRGEPGIRCGLRPAGNTTSTSVQAWPSHASLCAGSPSGSSANHSGDTVSTRLNRTASLSFLLKAEQDGADVFYLAPKFHDWEIYLEAFEQRRILRTSLIVSPGEIRRTLDAHGVPDGDHKIVYDERRTYLCSEPLELASVRASDLAGKLRARVESREAPIAEVLEDVFQGFEDRSAIRRSGTAERRDDSDRLIYAIPSDEGHQPKLRRERLDRILGSGRSRKEAIALAVGCGGMVFGRTVDLRHRIAV